MKAPYLNDKEFLKKFDLENRKEQYIRISVLDFKTEIPIASIEGKSTGGSCNLSGTSNMRRTATCSIAVDPWGIDGQQYHNITDIDNLISMNKKVRIFTGFINTLADLGWYKDQKIIWFPIGTFVIKTANISKNNSGINISLTLNDKCSLLNGDMGGTIPAATVFSEQELYNATGTVRETEKILLKDIIKYIVVEFGGEDSENVIITDIDDYIVKVMKWSGNSPIYLIKDENETNVRLTKEEPAEDANFSKYEYGQDVGYMVEPFVYPGTLECNAGESVAAVLDKIKNVLGNFEWFYDINGRFIFQQKKNYLNEAPSKSLLELNASDYFSKENFSISIYEFNEKNKKLLTSISSSPQFQNIKNDFIVWGTTKTATGVEKPIRYHLVFDDKPEVTEEPRLMLIYTDYRGLQAAIPLVEGENFVKGDPPILPTEEQKQKYYYKDAVFAFDKELKVFRSYPSYEICYVRPSEGDWRTELFYRGLEADDKSFSKNSYAAELNSEWTKICNLKGIDLEREKEGFSIYESAMRDTPTSSYTYWLDFIEGNVFNVNNIGRRSKVVNDKNSNCIFPSEVPNYIYILADGNVERILKEREQAAELDREVIQVGEDIFNNLTLGGSSNSAYDKIKELIYTHTTYNETVNLSVVPIYYLEPNTRISIFDNETSVNGDYMIKSISLPLTPNGTSNISATKCLDKTF